MFRVEREIHFSYAHRLPDHPGKCARLHGHNGRVVIEVSSEKLNNQGMVRDFYEIKETLGRWLDETLDHRTLLSEKDPLAAVLQKAGEKPVLMKEPPTAEAMAKLIFDEARRLKLPVTQVSLWETPTSCAVYEEK